LRVYDVMNYGLVFWTGCEHAHTSAQHTCDCANFSAGTILGLDSRTARARREASHTTGHTHIYYNAAPTKRDGLEHFTPNSRSVRGVSGKESRQVESRRLPTQRMCENRKGTLRRLRELAGRLEYWYKVSKRTKLH
jgi:hypothetical protein